jgi:hypothetical protein
MPSIVPAKVLSGEQHLPESEESGSQAVWCRGFTALTDTVEGVQPGNKQTYNSQLASHVLHGRFIYVWTQVHYKLHQSSGNARHTCGNLEKHVNLHDPKIHG